MQQLRSAESSRYVHGQVSLLLLRLPRLVTARDTHCHRRRRRWTLSVDVMITVLCSDGTEGLRGSVDRSRQCLAEADVVCWSRSSAHVFVARVSSTRVSCSNCRCLCSYPIGLGKISARRNHARCWRGDAKRAQPCSHGQLPIASPCTLAHLFAILRGASSLLSSESYYYISITNGTEYHMSQCRGL